MFIMRLALRYLVTLGLALSILGSVLPSLPASAQDPATASMRITFHGCPDGVDPNTDPGACTIPLDAPDAAVLQWEASSLQIANDVDRDPDGTYVIPNLPADTYMTFSGLEPVEHNHFLVIDHGDANDDFASGNDAWHPDMELLPGEVREVTAYYWNGAEGLDPDPAASLGFTFRGCPDGVNPETIGDPAATCTTPLDAPEAAEVAVGDETLAIADLPRANDGTYLLTDLAPFSVPTFFGLAGSVHDRYTVTEPAEIAGPTGYWVYLDRGEDANVTIYYWNDNGGDPGDESATLDLTLRGCPDGIDPREVADPVAECTIPLDAPDAAYAAWDPAYLNIAQDAERLYDGTYRISGIDGPALIELGGFEPSVRNSFVIFGADDYAGPLAYVDLDNGESVHLYVFYFNAGSDPLATPLA